jgi:Protein of unknown function (DUF3485)
VKSGFRILPPLVTLLLLAAIVATRPGTRGPPPGTDAYHERIRALAGRMPHRIGGWVGIDREVEKVAIALLQPNVIVSRRFRHNETGHTASFLLVHCRDSRDLDGHCPPVCHEAHGWVLEARQPCSWTVRDLKLDGMRYEFSKERIDGTEVLIVDSLLLLPDGTMARDVKAVSRVAQDQRLRHLGAAQVQIVYRSTMSVREREECFQALIDVNLDLIKALILGIPPGMAPVREFEK